MILNRILLAVAVCIGSITIAESISEAGDCYYGRGHGHGHHARGFRSGYAYRPPVVVARPYYGHAAPIYRHASPSYRAYSPYRGSYIGPNVGFGYGGYGRYGALPGYRGYGYGRSGVSIGIGF
jgi:hypothetical protein